jgi:hypothetical protein
MQRILAFFTKHMAKQETKPLGRWNLDYCTKVLDKKIDSSNEDHCGPCGQYNIPKQEAPEANAKKQKQV